MQPNINIMENREQQVCKHHGLTQYVMRSDGRFRCKKCAIEAVQKRRDKIKLLAIEYKGGKCIICNYNKCVQALEFHHLDPNEKEFGIAHKGITRSWEKTKIELDKCILLCSNCHREYHAGLIQLPFGEKESQKTVNL